jgi:hypothetical protein
MPVNRLVAVLTPVVFAPLAAAVAGWIAQHFPGLPALDPGQLVAIEVAGFTGAVGLAAHWLHGWQKHEARAARVGSNTAQPVSQLAAAESGPDFELEPLDPGDPDGLPHLSTEDAHQVPPDQGDPGQPEAHG